MKTKRLLSLLTAIHFGIQTVHVRGQSDLQAVSQEPIRWQRYTYGINSSYPYLNELPTWSNIPVLLEWINRESGDAGTEVAYTQVVALSRADFKHPQHPPAGGLPKETVKYYQSDRSEAWARWWKSVGQNHGERLRTAGRQNAEAWKLVTGDKTRNLPDYKIVIPDEWTLKTSYRAGDYGGRQTESLTLRRSKEKATLIRALRKSTTDPLEWERWEPLTTEQADNFAFAMAYAIDKPWLLKSKRDNNTQKKIEGRNLTVYYPDFRYEFADMDGSIWWNDDPWSWYGGDSFMDISGLGSVCRLIWRTFPDDSVTHAASSINGKWSQVKIPDATMVQSITEDLVLRGEIIDLLSHNQRIADGLGALAEFGAPAQISAISQLETELPLRMEKVKNILEQDINGELPKLHAKRLLTAAAKAKAAIQKRNNNQK